MECKRNNQESGIGPNQQLSNIFIQEVTSTPLTNANIQKFNGQNKLKKELPSTISMPSLPLRNDLGNYAFGKRVADDISDDIDIKNAEEEEDDDIKSGGVYHIVTNTTNNYINNNENNNNTDNGGCCSLPEQFYKIRQKLIDAGFADARFLIWNNGVWCTICMASHRTGPYITLPACKIRIAFWRIKRHLKSGVF